MKYTKMLIAGLAFASFLTLGSVSAKADTATAASLVPILRTMYHVDLAESIVNDKNAVLKSCYANNASEYEKALAQSAVNSATNLLNTLNVLIARDTALTEPAPPGVVNPATFATNSLMAQQAWNDYLYREKILRALPL